MCRFSKSVLQKSHLNRSVSRLGFWTFRNLVAAVRALFLVFCFFLQGAAAAPPTPAASPPLPGCSRTRRESPYEALREHNTAAMEWTRAAVLIWTSFSGWNAGMCGSIHETSDLQWFEETKKQRIAWIYRPLVWTTLASVHPLTEGRLIRGVWSGGRGFKRQQGWPGEDGGSGSLGEELPRPVSSGSLSCVQADPSTATESTRAQGGEAGCLSLMEVEESLRLHGALCPDCSLGPDLVGLIPVYLLLVQHCLFTVHMMCSRMCVWSSDSLWQDKRDMFRLDEGRGTQ